MSITRTSAPTCSGNDECVVFVRDEVPKQGRVAGKRRLSRQAHALDGFGADHNGQGRVNAAGDADHAVVKTGVGHALYKAGHLDVDHAAA